MLKVGDKAPEFRLQDDSGKEVSLSDLSGKKVVLYFYPKDDTPGCTKEACAFRDDFAKYGDLNAVIYGVSPDSIEKHQKFKKKYSLPFPLLADPNHELANAYGVWGEKKFMGRIFDGIIRSTFIIDEEGKVEKIYRKVKVAGHSEDVLQALSS